MAGVGAIAELFAQSLIQGDGGTPFVEPVGDVDPVSAQPRCDREHGQGVDAEVTAPKIGQPGIDDLGTRQPRLVHGSEATAGRRAPKRA